MLSVSVYILTLVLEALQSVVNLCSDEPHNQMTAVLLIPDSSHPGPLGGQFPKLELYDYAA